MARRQSNGGRWICAGLIGGLAAAAGCASPLDRTSEQALRDQLLTAHRRQLEAVAGAPVVEVERTPSDVERQLEEEGRIEELDAMSGPSAYTDPLLDIGEDLLGQDEPEVARITLQRAIELAVKNNLNLDIARLRPAIAEARLVQAEAAFDAVFFTDVDWAKLDTPQPQGAIPGISGDTQSETLTINSGLRKRLYSGGQLSVETAISREETQPSVFGVPSFYDADALVSLQQPILRGFGADVTRAEILLLENARLREIEQLKETLLDLALSTEQAYWNLVFARARLAIQLRLLERTIEDRNTLIERRGFDVSPVRITEANSFVELRRAEVIRARALLRQQSDLLKRLINDPGLPVADETLLLPADDPIEAPITFSLLDAVTTAVRYRPELERALLEIRDASIRQRVADNARLPILTLAATVGLNGVDVDSAGDAYESLADGDYIDYLISGQFEYPLGNRAAEALHTQRRLERRASVLAYRELVQQRVLEVKNTLRDVLTAYKLIAATRAARRAAADSLRAIDEQERIGVAGLTPEFLLDLKLQTQQRVAEAEIQEIDALTNYNIAIAAFYEAVGTLLQRNGIEFEPAEAAAE